MLALMLATLGAVACGPAPSPQVPRTDGGRATATLWPLPGLTARPAITPSQPAATPVIIASPTPSPTPVMHVVKEGETLVGIALQYGISLDALQQANPTVSPRFLSVGTALIIPVSPEALPAQAAGAPTPMPLVFGSPACHSLPTGAMYCLVEARNPGEVALENVTARITLAAADGLPLADAVAQSGVDVIGPGDSGPLAALFPSAPGGVAAIGVSAVSALPLQDVSSRYVALDVAPHSGEAIGNRWRVSGQVSNGSGVPATAVRIVVTLYAADDRLVGYRQIMLSDGLAAGATRDFVIEAQVLSGAATRYTILAEGRP